MPEYEITVHDENLPRLDDPNKTYEAKVVRDANGKRIGSFYHEAFMEFWFVEVDGVTDPHNNPFGFATQQECEAYFEGWNHATQRREA